MRSPPLERRSREGMTEYAERRTARCSSKNAVSTDPSIAWCFETKASKQASSAKTKTIRKAGYACNQVFKSNSLGSLGRQSMRSKGAETDLQDQNNPFVDERKPQDNCWCFKESTTWFMVQRYSNRLSARMADLIQRDLEERTMV